MKKFYYAIAVAAVCFASCNKEEVVTTNDQEDSHLVQMSFTASTIDTKTTLGALSTGQYPVLWSDSDEIKVIAVDSEGVTLHTDTFTIDAGGSSTATFTGTTYAEASAYYAVYPASFNATVSGTGSSATIALSDYKSHSVTAVEDGFDPSRVVMFAVADDGNFTFKHGVSFFKITIGIDDVKSVEFRVPSSDGGARIFGNPTYKVSDGTTTGYSGADKANNYVTLAPTSGTLTKGATYYVPFAAKASSLTTYLQLTYTVGDDTASKKTTKLNGTFANGHVYDLGTPPISFGPSISATNPSKLAYDATSGSFTFTISNPDGVSEPSVALTAGSWIHNTDSPLDKPTISGPVAGVYTVSFNCDANDGVSAVERNAAITISYPGAADKEVTITQGINSSPTFTWDFTEDKASFSYKTDDIYKYDSGSASVAGTQTESEVLYLVSTSSKEIKTGNKTCTSDSKKYYYVTYSGVANYMFFNTSHTGTLYVKATLNKSASESGNCKLGVRIDDVLCGTDVDLTNYDTSKDELDMVEYSWTITNASGDPQKIAIIKPSGSNAPWIFEIRFVTD